MFAYSLSCWQFSYSFLDGCEEFETFTWTFFQNRITFRYSYRSQYYFPVFILISGIGTTFLYFFRSPVSVPFSCIMIRDNDIYCAYLLVVISPACYHLTCYYMPLLDTWLLHVTTWHLFDITYHLPPDTWLLDLWLSYLREFYLDIVYYIQRPESIALM